MNLFTGMAAAAVASGTTGPLVSAATMVEMGICIVLLVGVMIAAIVYIVTHFGTTWGNGVVVGIISYLLFCYLLYAVVLFGLNSIPACREFFENSVVGYTWVQFVVTILLELACIFGGVKYLETWSAKKGQMIDAGSILSFSLAFYGAYILTSGIVSNHFQFIMFAASINSLGMDKAISAIVANGVPADEAETMIRSFVELNGIELLVDSLNYILKGISVAAISMVIYGANTGRVDKKWNLAAAGAIVLNYLPALLLNFTKLPTAVRIVVSILLTAVYVFTAYRLLKNDMPDDWQKMKEKPVKKHSVSQKNEKMPTIHMPD